MEGSGVEQLRSTLRQRGSSPLCRANVINARYTAKWREVGLAIYNRVHEVWPNKTMVIEIPSANDFFHASSDSLNLAWDIAVDLSRELRAASEDGDTERCEIAGEYWSRAQRRLGSAVALIHQGLELGVKANIAQISPYLLIANSPERMPGYQPTGTPFSEFRTLDAKDLLHVHDLFTAVRLPNDFKELFEDGRRLRNQFIHGVTKGERIAYHQVYSDILRGFALMHGGSHRWPEVRVEYLRTRASESVVRPFDLALGRAVFEFGTS